MASCCGIWKNRNAQIFNNHAEDFRFVITEAVKHQENFSHANSLESPALQQYLHTSTWSPPPFTFLKLNFDAAVDEVKNRGAYAVVVRDHLGHLIKWRCRQWNSFSDPLILEGLACREALLLARNLNISRVIVEGDSAIVIKACLSPLL